MGNQMQGVGEFLVGLVMLINLIISILGWLMSRHTAYLARHTADKIAHLEVNTNSIKDELVKVTGEAERAKGVLEGIASAKKTQD